MHCSLRGAPGEWLMELVLASRNVPCFCQGLKMSQPGGVSRVGGKKISNYPTSYDQSPVRVLLAQPMNPARLKNQYEIWWPTMCAMDSICQPCSGQLHINRQFCGKVTVSYLGISIDQPRPTYKLHELPIATSLYKFQLHKVGATWRNPQTANKIKE